MPKACSSSSARPALRRNQACLACRKRKLKCDASRPHCGTCVKQWQALISVPPPVGYAHPPEPQCSYDPIEGLAIAPDVDPTEKIRILEEQICTSANHSTLIGLFLSKSLSPTQKPAQPNTPADLGLRVPTGALSSARVHMSSGSPDSQGRSFSGSPDLSAASQPPSMAEMDMLLNGWDVDLPRRDVLNHYVDVYFRCDPCSTHVLHRPSFLASLDLHPRDPSFPHSAILHAICASASRWVSNDTVTLPDGTRQDKFAERHVRKTREYIDKTMATGQDIFQVLQACLLLSWYFYQEGRWVEVWIFAGFQARVAVPLRLNYPGTFSAQSSNAPGGYLPPPRDFRDLEARRRTWWMTVMFDRIVSMGGWVHSIDQRDIGTEFPVRLIDFEADSGIASNPQDLASKEVFIRHPPEYTDSFLLFLKSVMLFGMVTDYNTRSSLRAPAPPSKNQNPFHMHGFQELDKLVCLDFLDSFPQAFRHMGLTGDAGVLDTDLYMARIAPHAAAITLHNPYINFSDPSSVSTARCVTATREILRACYKLSETSLETTRLHPFVTIVWYLAAVVQIQLCKYFIEIGDVARESTVWGEINALRFAMLTYGSRSPIGTRQEKLLQGLMTEIVRMTSQPQPLEVGVPLYPFSHASAFSKEATSQDLVCAPLPGAQSFEVPSSMVPPMMPTLPTHSAAADNWARHAVMSPSLAHATATNMHQHPTALSVSSYPRGY
ncbi:hypothetical protein POSPLADRAFT_1176282 [Postia placenta MAD-698-R-SB12]|uniref:Zn(2)-C6 fungal-type domain-containing protein n=1 Tax=Postia placenta MAD-698-R-SB12 TaxID=670580 RepID=A0A1X6NFM8_9APHY|nr:hypothetical protein POSPLADRAFT_1176282 [Postia placenta MAD-698-R-SB12]OSX67451.1 hypothetical protein POSPLADRAFT_1176282 [Postia placenta MAD-698-R-SB12]